MRARTCLVLAACASAVLAPAPAHAQGYCNFSYIGLLAGERHALRDGYMQPHQREYIIKVDLNNMFPCARGARLEACDADAPPDVAMLDAQHARVRRRGALRGYGTLRRAVYCPAHAPHTPQ